MPVEIALPAVFCEKKMEKTHIHIIYVRVHFRNAINPILRARACVQCIYIHTSRLFPVNDSRYNNNNIGRVSISVRFAENSTGDKRKRYCVYIVYYHRVHLHRPYFFSLYACVCVCVCYAYIMVFDFVYHIFYVTNIGPATPYAARV